MKQKLSNFSKFRKSDKSMKQELDQFKDSASNTRGGM